MIFQVMTQLLCMDCCWFTPVWARMYLKLHRAFYRQGLQNNPPVLLPCIYSFTVSICCSLHQAWSTCAYLPYRLCFCPLSQSFVVIKFNLLVWSRRIDGVCLKLPIYDPLLVGKNPPQFWGGSWEGSVSHTDGLATTPLSPRVYCQTPSHSSNFPKLLSYPGRSLGSTIDGNFTMPENSSTRFPPPVTLYQVLTEFSFIH